jgi:hypothetical protein
MRGVGVTQEDGWLYCIEKSELSRSARLSSTEPGHVRGE